MSELWSCYAGPSTERCKGLQYSAGETVARAKGICCIRIMNSKYTHKNRKLGTARHSSKPSSMVEEPRQRQKDHWGLLVLSVAPGSVRDPVSKE